VVQRDVKGTTTEKRSRTVAVLAWLLVLACGVTTITLALLFPVRKHKFTRFHCVSHDEVSTLATAAVTDVVPAAVDLVCGKERSACDAARSVSGAELVAFCGANEDCLELAKKSPTPFDDAARSGHLAAVEDALQGFFATEDGTSNDAANASSSRNFTASCLLSSVCDAAEGYMESPELYCANSVEAHADTCRSIRKLVKTVGAEAREYCTSQGGATELGCNIFNTSLHDRGHWEAYCKPFLQRIECTVIQSTVNDLIQSKVCDRSDEFQRLCDAGYAIAHRWEDVDAPLPIYDVLVDAGDIYCSEGGLLCDGYNASSFLRDEVTLLKRNLPSICGAWPVTEELCANATVAAATFCQQHPSACDLLRELKHLNRTTAESNFVDTWQKAQALCTLSTEQARQTKPTLIRHAFGQQGLVEEGTDAATNASSSDGIQLDNIVQYACDAVNAVDALAEDCPDMLPVISEALLPSA